MPFNTKDSPELKPLYLTRRDVKFSRHDGITRAFIPAKEFWMKILLLISILYLMAADVVAWDKLILMIF